MPHPEPRTKSKRKDTLNAKAVCITDDAILEDLKNKKLEKAEAKKEKKIEKERKRVTKQLERERKKKIREEKQLNKECKKVVREGKQLKRNSARSGRKPDQGGIVLKRKELMMSLQLCTCCRVQVVKMIPLIKIQEKIMGFLPKRFRRR